MFPQTHLCLEKGWFAGLRYCLSYLPLTVRVVRGLENYDDKSIADNRMNFQILQRPPQTLTMYRVTTCHEIQLSAADAVTAACVWAEVRPAWG